MAATAAAAVASSFSQSINAVKCMRFKQLTPDHHHQSLRIPSATVSSRLRHHHSYFTHELFPTVRKRRTPEVSAAVAQQETAEETAPVEDSSAEEKGEGEVETVVNTKLYFGNLPTMLTVLNLLRLYKIMAVQNLLSLNRKNRCTPTDSSFLSEPVVVRESETLTQAFREYGNVVGARFCTTATREGLEVMVFVSYSQNQDGSCHSISQRCGTGRKGIASESGSRKTIVINLKI
ncbi:hypothetical protein F3Y22_tig00007043pilonHSYRG00040 [Hibiscus syriacus]|uniref:RRM domain-containing protein n=1 Tax=Hibiscus syriacus TaxID=106335 RepID=A0A6A3CFA2_HIBSY|nr:hypothetical protein F3Y22_tig00007043pilonHSYRG00040 [Hibiscus syriacus]